MRPLPTDSSSVPRESSPCFFTQFTNDYRMIKKAIQQNLNILRCDPILGKHLSSQPTVIFRKAKCVKNAIAPSQWRVEQGSSITTFSSISGRYRRGKRPCKICQHMLHGHENFTGPNNQSFNSNEFITYSTPYVVYGLTCLCDKLYMGRTIRPLRERFHEHRLSVKKGYPHLSVSCHFLDKHKKTCSC